MMQQQQQQYSYELVLQQFLQRQDDLLKNCPPQWIEKMMPYVNTIMSYFKKIPQIKTVTQQLFFVDLIFGYTRIYEIYNKKQNGQQIYQNIYDITSELYQTSLILQKIWSLENKIKQYYDLEWIGKLKQKLSEHLQTLRVITQNDLLQLHDIIEQVDNTTFYVFEYKIGLSGLSSFDGTRVYISDNDLQDPLITLCHEICHNLTRYKQKIDCRQISPQKNPLLQINGKMVEAGFYFENVALKVKLYDYQLNPFSLKYRMWQN